MKILSTNFKTYNQSVILNHYDQTDHISKRISKGKTFYEFGMLDYIYKNVPLNGTYIDAGANIGNHTVFFSLFCADKVFAIEPVPENVKILEKNVESNNLKNVKILPYGVGKVQNSRKIVRFNTNMGSCMLEENPDPNEIVENKKKVITGDSVEVKTPEQLELSNISDLTLLKIDCEIMSLEVLESFKELISHNSPHIFIEATSKDLKKIEEMIGYIPVRRFNATPTYHMVKK